MTSAEQVVQNALAAVAASRALREKAAEDRKPLYVPKGVQMPLRFS